MAFFKIFRGTKAQVDAQGISDGTFLYTTDQSTGNKLYADVGSYRYDLLNNFLSDNKTIYVATTGNDTTGTGLVGAPYATITKALSMMPKNLNGFDATINIDAGTYAETVTIQGFHGGMLNIILGGAVTINKLVVEETQYVYISSGSVNTLTLAYIPDRSFSIMHGTRVQCYNVNVVINTSTSYAGLMISDASIFTSVNDVTINNAGQAIQIINSSMFSCATLSGTGNNIGVYGANGSTISYTTKTISATTATSLNNGAKILNDITQFHPATVGTGTVVATSLTVGQVFTAPSDGSYQITTGFLAGDGYLQINHSNGKKPQINPSASAGYTHWIDVPINAGQKLTINSLSKIQSTTVSFFPQV